MMVEILTLPTREDLDMGHAIFARPDLNTFCLLDRLGLNTTGRCLEPDRAVILVPGGPNEGAVPSVRVAGNATQYRRAPAGVRPDGSAAHDSACQASALPVS